jgi:UDP-glucose 6-dehydrogenase
MKVCVVGVGYVGLVTAGCLADAAGLAKFVQWLRQ